MKSTINMEEIKQEQFNNNLSDQCKNCKYLMYKYSTGVFSCKYTGEFLREPIINKCGWKR